MKTILVLALFVSTAAASDLRSTLAATDDGRVRFEYPTREGVVGDGPSLILRGDADWDACE